nr:hypothetical protein [Tanacetum cinerariifolium]
MVTVMQNTNNTTIRLILLAEKLTGSNFTNSYHILRIFLRYEKKMKFVEQPIRPAPDPETADPDTIDKYYESVNLETEIRKDKKKPQGEKGKAKGKNKLAYAPKTKIPPPTTKDNPTKDSICHHQKEGRQVSFATSKTRTYTPGASGSNFGKQRTVICYKCKEEGHMSKQCTKPKKKQELAFLVDPRIVEGQATQTVITHNTAYQVDDLDAYDIDCDELYTAKVAPMANLSHYGLDALTEKAQQLELKLYDGNVIKNNCTIVIPNSTETLMLAEESHSKMLLKQ